MCLRRRKVALARTAKIPRKPRNLPKKSLHKLQKVQNSAARLITKTSKYSHITPVLNQLHWLPIEKRIQFKIITLIYECLHNMAPDYLSENIRKYIPARTLRSSSSNDLVVPEHSNSFGKRSLFYAGPVLWNSLPHNITSIDSYNLFKSSLKTYLFKK